MPDAASRVDPATTILEARDLNRAFRRGPRRIEVLKSASMEVQEREFVAIVGLSGVGKSTLLHILGALDQPDTGEIRFRDRDVLRMNANAVARLRNQSIGFVFQFHHLLPEFTAIENVMMPARVGGKSQRAAREAAGRLLDKVGLGHRLDHRPSELSGGEQQRVAVARAIVNGPDLLLADEPSGNLDPKTGQMIYDLLFDLRDTLGQTIVVTTHSANLASQCDRVLELREGRLFPFGDEAWEGSE